jgi:hypothetical protein
VLIRVTEEKLRAEDAVAAVGRDDAGGWRMCVNRLSATGRATSMSCSVRPESWELDSWSERAWIVWPAMAITPSRRKCANPVRRGFIEYAHGPKRERFMRQCDRSSMSACGFDRRSENKRITRI